MLKIKKVFSVLLIVIFCVFIFSKNINASQSTAKLKGIDSTGITYLYDMETPRQNIYGSVYTYGYVRMWSSVYSWYSESDDIMYYFVFVESTVCGKKKDNNLFFHAKNLDVFVSCKCKNTIIDLVTYTPKASEYNVSDVRSFTVSPNLGANLGTNGANINGNIGLSVQHNITTGGTDANLYYEVYKTHYREAQISAQYQLRYYAEKNNERSPYIGEFIKMSSYVFAVNNYQQISDTENIEISIDYTGQIYRGNTKKKSDHYDLGRTLGHLYLFRDNELTFKYEYIFDTYDFTSGKYNPDL